MLTNSSVRAAFVETITSHSSLLPNWVDEHLCSPHQEAERYSMKRRKGGNNFVILLGGLVILICIAAALIANLDTPLTQGVRDFVEGVKTFLSIS